MYVLVDECASVFVFQICVAAGQCVGLYRPIMGVLYRIVCISRSELLIYIYMYTLNLRCAVIIVVFFQVLEQILMQVI